MRTSEIINTAADLIQEHGWDKGAGWPMSDDHTGPLCLEGGIMAAMGLHLDEHAETNEKYATFVTCPAYRAVQEYLDLKPVVVDPVTYSILEGDTLWIWNDGVRAAWTGKSRVIQTLRAAAAVQAAREEAEVPVPV